MASGILLKVTPADLKRENSNVTSVKNDTHTVVDGIYRVKNALIGCKYKSDSATTYGNHMEQFRKHFVSLEALLDEYIQFLNSASTRYNVNEDGLVGKANGLPV